MPVVLDMFPEVANMLCLHACSRPSKTCSLWCAHCGRTPMITLSWEYPPALQWPLLSLDGLQISSKLWSLKIESVKWHVFIMVNQVSYGKYSSNLKLRWGPPTFFLTFIAYSKKNQCATWAQSCHLPHAIASNNCCKGMHQGKPQLQIFSNKRDIWRNNLKFP